MHSCFWGITLTFWSNYLSFVIRVDHVWEITGFLTQIACCQHGKYVAWVLVPGNIIMFCCVSIATSRKIILAVLAFLCFPISKV